jgi:hypothetical protein
MILSTCPSYETLDYTFDIEEYKRASSQYSAIPEDLRSRVGHQIASFLWTHLTHDRPKTAKKLAESGFRTLEDIMADEDTFAKLPRAIQTSMKHNSKILKQIQRDDIDRLSTLISDTLKEFDVYITGS